MAELSFAHCPSMGCKNSPRVIAQFYPPRELRVYQSDRSEFGFALGLNGLLHLFRDKTCVVFLTKILLRLFAAWRRTEQGGVPKNVFMVFEYLEYDLTGVLDTPEIRFTEDHVKSWSQQLLMGVHYMHKQKVIHRDLKASNLLINRKGELKIADLGLARSWNSEMKRLTNKVITLWYRPPELLLGMTQYTPKIDMWSVGCIITEIFRRSGFLKGANEATQLDLIFQVVGHPVSQAGNPNDWPDIKQKCPLWKKFQPEAGKPIYPNRLKQALKSQLLNPKWMTDAAVELISMLMTLDPDKRWDAEQALLASYFFESPMVKKMNELSMNFSVNSVHEWECRRKHEAKHAAKVKAQQNVNAKRG